MSRFGGAFNWFFTHPQAAGLRQFSGQYVSYNVPQFIHNQIHHATHLTAPQPEGAAGVTPYLDSVSRGAQGLGGVFGGIGGFAAGVLAAPIGGAIGGGIGAAIGTPFGMPIQGGLAGAAIGTAVSPIIGGAAGAKLIHSLVGIPEALHKFAEGVNDANKGLARFNGIIAVAYAKQQFGDLRRAFGRANETSGSAAELADAIDGFRDEIEPGVREMLHIMNGLATTAIGVASRFTGFFNWSTATLREILIQLRLIPKAPPGGAKSPPFLEAMERWAAQAKHPRL